jgi:hypothetical protein
VPCQAETYQRKGEQARQWAAAAYAGNAPAFIAAEAIATNVTAQQVAEQVIQLADYWSGVKGPEIEAARRKWKVRLAACVDGHAVQQTLADGLAELEGL